MWEILQLSFDSWIGVAALLTLVLILVALPSGRPYASGLLLPSVLLFLRKALLYLPVLGAVSTEDKVMFWSTAALFCYSISLLSAACIISWIIKAKSWGDSNVFQRVARLVGVFGPWISAGALGAIGWSIPFVAALSLSGGFKVLIVSPALFPMTVTAIFVHLVRGCFAGALLSREINKLLLICVIAAGAVQFCASLGQLSTVRGVINVEEDWPGRQSDMIGADRFPRAWLLALPGINRCGLNLPLDRKEQAPDCGISDAIKKVPGFRPTGLHITLFVGAALILLAGAVERGAGGEEDYATAGHSQ